MKLDFCCICGTKENLHHHHITPRFRGGSDDETNLITLCGTHHAWIHGLQPTSWNNHGNAVKESLKEAKKSIDSGGYAYLPCLPDLAAFVPLHILTLPSPLIDDFTCTLFSELFTSTIKS